LDAVKELDPLGFLSLSFYGKLFTAIIMQDKGKGVALICRGAVTSEEPLC